MAAIYPTRATRSPTPSCWPTRGSARGPLPRPGSWPTRTGDHLVDITDRFDRKLAALRARVEPDRAHGRPRRADARVGRVKNGEAGGLPEGRLAERFFVVSTA